MGIDRRRYLLAAGGSDNYDPDTELYPRVYAYGINRDKLWVWDSCDLNNAGVSPVTTNIHTPEKGNGFVNCHDEFVWYDPTEQIIKVFNGIESDTEIPLDTPPRQASTFCGGVLDGAPVYHAYNNVNTTTVFKADYLTDSFTVKRGFASRDRASELAAVSADGQYVLIGGEQGYSNSFISRDYGETWSETLATSSYGNGTTDLDMSNDGQYAIKTAGDKIAYSNDYLSSFHVIDTESEFRESPYGATVSGDGSVMYAYVAGQIIASEDGGSTWTVRCPGIQHTSKLTCSYRGKVVLAHVNGTNLHYSTDFGRTFTRAEIPESEGVCDFFIRRVPSE